MSLEITLVPYGALTMTLMGLWKYLETASAITSGRSSVDDIVQQFFTGRYNLWVAFDPTTKALHGFFATEIKQYPQRRLLCVQHCVMDPGELEALEEKVQELGHRFAKDSGCSGIEFVGRPGWKRYAKRHGYTANSVMYQQFFEVKP